jgi:hypothetical protein
MTDTMRWRYGDTNPVVTKPIASGVTIEIGDLVEQDSSGNVTPASALTWTTDLPTTQAAFHTSFLGVAMQRSRSTDTDPIRVATSGVFEMACASATFNIGDLVGPAKDTGNALQDQAVVAVGAGGNEGKAVGRIANYVNPANTQVLVSIVSTKQFGGPQAAS